MGLIGQIMNAVFGGGKNVIAETAEVFRVNSENEAQRTAEFQAAALSQFGKEFAHERKGLFDRSVDGLNRLPRPIMARMEGLALVPEPLWWMLGVIVSFFFGARHQAKVQGFQSSIAKTVAAGKSMHSVDIETDTPQTPRVASTQSDASLEASTLKVSVDNNAALEDWARGK